LSRESEYKGALPQPSNSVNADVQNLRKDFESLKVSVAEMHSSRKEFEKSMKTTVDDLKNLMTSTVSDMKQFMSDQFSSSSSQQKFGERKLSCFRCSAAHRVSDCPIEPSAIRCQKCSQVGHCTFMCGAGANRRGGGSSEHGQGNFKRQR
jgi:hypothetical protein